MNCLNIFKTGFSCLILLILCACNTSSEPYVAKDSDKLSPSEKRALINNARDFIFKSKKLKLKPSEIDIISTRKPDMRISYSAPKEGRASISWEISPKRKILALAAGKLLEEDRFWMVKIITQNDVIYMKDGKEVKAPELKKNNL